MGRKAENTKKKLLDAAIKILAKDGLEGLTFQAIADACKVTQPLVVHYFKKSDEIFPALMEYMLEFTLTDTVEALQKQPSPSEQLKEYISVSFGFFRKSPELFKLYLTFYYMSGFHKRYRQINNQLKLEATQRIMEILAKGIASHEFNVNSLSLTAKQIHVYLTGALLNLASESENFANDAFIGELQKHVLQMAGVSNLI